VLDRLAGDDGLSGTRKRDLRSAVTSFAKLKGQPPAAVPLDLADIRNTLDGMVAAQAKVSRASDGTTFAAISPPQSRPRAYGPWSEPLTLN
jgi:hypothetical protein